jgi:hypothetical protein
LKKNGLFIVVYIVLIVVLGLPSYIKDSKADIIDVYGTGAGNFLPKENCSLIMTNASVVFNVDAEEYLSRINIDFTGNYTIFNPGESMNATLVAPFSLDFENLESSCVIKIENTTVPYDFLEYNFTESPWEEYLQSQYFMQNRKFLIINATFPENDSITIEYSFDANIGISSSVGILNIYYDVGTSRAWNGTITERVEFRVYGKPPDSYSSYRKDRFEYNCTISDITNGKSYAWEWENEIINVNSVYISYSYFNPWVKLVPIILFPLLFGGIIIFVASSSTRKKRNERKARRELRHPN